MPSRTLPALGLLLLTLTPFSLCAQQPSEPVEWLTDAALTRKLELPAGVRWQARPLGEGVAGLSRLYGVSVILDRRLDPNRPVDVAFQDIPLRDGLATLAAQADASVSRIENVLLIAPNDAADRIATAAALLEQSLKEAPSEVRRVWERDQATRWPRLTEPQAKIVSLVDAEGLTILNPEKLPHDLWPETDWPALSLSARISLIVGQFDLMATTEDGRQITLVPLPERLTLERSYALGSDPQSRLTELSRLAPDAEIRRDGRWAMVVGTAADHEAIDQGRRRPIRPGRVELEKRYTLTVERKPLEPVMQALASQMGLTLEMDFDQLQAAGITRNSLVSIQVTDETAEKLFRELLEPLGLAARIDGKRLIVTQQ
jgi:hypothetical protein